MFIHYVIGNSRVYTKLVRWERKGVNYHTSIFPAKARSELSFIVTLVESLLNCSCLPVSKMIFRTYVLGFYFLNRFTMLNAYHIYISSRLYSQKEKKEHSKRYISDSRPLSQCPLLKRCHFNTFPIAGKIHFTALYFIWGLRKHSLRWLSSAFCNHYLFIALPHSRTKGS